jgi:hypothetical protein
MAWSRARREVEGDGRDEEKTLHFDHKEHKAHKGFSLVFLCVLCGFNTSDPAQQQLHFPSR